MRYLRGSIALSETRDYPVLRRVLHSGFSTAGQLYEFMQLDYCSSSRTAFDNRLRRLVAHGLLVRHNVPSMNRGVVYSIAPAGASELIPRGEFYSGSTDRATPIGGHVQHAVELNDIHLALKRTGLLLRWTPESDIRSRSEFTGVGCVKDYDAGVAVQIDGHERRFALEYERTAKANRRYDIIRQRIEDEREFSDFLYLVPNHDLMLFLIRQFKSCTRRVHFGLRADFLSETLYLLVQNNHSPVSTSFRSVLSPALPVSNKASTTVSQKLLF